MRAILVVGLLALSTLAFAPNAAAAPGYECAQNNVTGGVVDEGVLQVNLRRDCSLEAVVAEGILCVGGWGGSVERNVAQHTVRAYYCTGGPLPDIATTDAAGPALPCSGGSDNLGVATVQYHTTCQTQVDVKLYDCVFNCGYRTVVDTPLLKVRVYQENPGANAAAAGPDCTKAATYKSFGVGDARVSTDCQITVQLEPYQCIWGGRWVETSAGPVTLRRYQCDPYQDPYATSAAPGIPIDPCPITRTPDQLAGFVLVEQDKNPCLDTHVTVGRDVCNTSTTSVDRVALTTCDIALATSDARPACNGIWYTTGSETLPTGTTVSYGTNLQPQCTVVTVEQDRLSCTIDTTPGCSFLGMAAAADPLPPPSCGIVYREYTVGPVTVGESNPCFGIRVDAGSDDCRSDVGTQIWSVAVAVDTCLE